MTIQLTPEEHREYEKYLSRMQGVIEGAQMAMEHAKRVKLEEILASRTSRKTVQSIQTGVDENVSAHTGQE